MVSIATTRKKRKKDNKKPASKATGTSAELTDIEMKLLRLTILNFVQSDKGVYEGEAINSANGVAVL